MIPFSLPVGWFDGSQTTQKLLFKSNCSGAFLFSLSTLSFRFNFTCQNLAHSLLKMEKLRLKMNSMQQMMTCKHTQKSEIPWKKNTIHTSHKHVTIFISLLDVFSSQPKIRLARSSVCVHNSDGSMVFFALLLVCLCRENTRLMSGKEWAKQFPYANVA